MKTITAKLSSKNQMTLPKEARQALNIKAGDTVILVVAGDSVRLCPRPTSLTDYLCGLGEDLWKELGGADEYLRAERESWPG